MFKNTKSNSMADNNNFDTNAIDRIAEGTTFEGKLQSSKGMRIDGKVIGTIICEGKVVVGKNGMVEGELTCENADIEGTLNAVVKIKDLLELKSTGSIDGEISTGRLSIEPGANFTGNCNMGGKKQTTPSPNDKKQKQGVQEKA